VGARGAGVAGRIDLPTVYNSTPFSTDRKSDKILKIHPDLGAAVMRCKLERYFRVWTIARSLDPEGSGRVSIAVLQKAFDDNGIRGTKPDTVKRLLRAGHGVWWRVTPEWVYLRGLAQVCAALELPRLRKNPVIIPLQFAKSLRAFRAALHASQFAGDKFSNPISRKVLTGITGYSRRTQSNWERALPDTIEKRKNGQATDLPWQRGDPVPDGHYITVIGGKATVVKRLPQSYRSALFTAQRGRMRKANNFLSGNSCRQGVGPEHQFGPCALATNDGRQGWQEQRAEKLFYYERTAAKRRWDQLTEGESFYIARTDQYKRPVRDRSGAVLWQRVQVHDECLFFS